jgi:hypothetical protein
LAAVPVFDAVLLDGQGVVGLLVAVEPPADVELPWVVELLCAWSGAAKNVSRPATARALAAA